MTTEPTKPWKILFVCLGNICRSPAAEGIMKKYVEAEGLSDRIWVDSAGTCNYHTGQLADPRMLKAAHRRGYDLTSRARTITNRDLRDFHLIVAMDSENFRQVHLLTSDAASHVKLLSDFLNEDWPKNVPDPYYGGDEGFDFVIDMIEQACPKILDTYRKA